MKLNMYSVYDNKAQAFIPPFHMINHAVAIRAVTQALHDSSHQFAKNPTDYNLFHVGEFEDSTGAVSAINPPVNLGLLDSFKE